MPKTGVSSGRIVIFPENETNETKNKNINIVVACSWKDNDECGVHAARITIGGCIGGR